MAIDELCVIGHPSFVGGADTELADQISCWLAMGIRVHICPTSPLDLSQCSMQLKEAGCIYHEHSDWESLDGLHCISFCNGEFLRNLPFIRKFARSTTFVNCMTWNFDEEIAAQEHNLIDFHLYQTEHGYQRVSLKLRRFESYKPLFFTPFFDCTRFPLVTNRDTDKFRFGRISRDDADKFGTRQLWIYETMTAPVPKEGLILGWSTSVEAKFKRTPDPFIHSLPAGSLSQRAFYTQCEAVIMTTDTFENLPRVGFEAMSSGSVLVVDNRGGWRNQVAFELHSI